MKFGSFSFQNHGLRHSIHLHDLNVISTKEGRHIKQIMLKHHLDRFIIKQPMFYTIHSTLNGHLYPQSVPCMGADFYTSIVSHFSRCSNIIEHELGILHHITSDINFDLVNSMLNIVAHCFPHLMRAIHLHCTWPEMSKPTRSQEELSTNK